MSIQSLVRVSIFGLYTLLLFQVSNTLSLSLFEAELFYGEDVSLLYYPLHFITENLGQNDLAVRGLMIFIHLLSLWFYYQISKLYLKKEKDRKLNLFIFILLPGSVSSALIVHDTGLVLLALLVFIWVYQKDEKYAWALLPFYFFIDAAFFILFLALFLQSLSAKRYYRMFYAGILMIGSFYLFGFPTDIKPSGYFLETLGIFALVLSPLLFIYFLYTIFRVATKGEKELLWYISASSLIVALALSFRQKIPLEQFAPFMMLLLPVMIKQFFHSLRMRIKQQRRFHHLFLTLVLFFLLVNSIIFYFNKLLFVWIETPQRHFLYDHYIAKELAQQLQAKQWTEILVYDKSLQKRLRFYGISAEDAKYKMAPKGCQNVSISYINRPISSFCVTKINK